MSLDFEECECFKTRFSIRFQIHLLYWPVSLDQKYIILRVVFISYAINMSFLFLAMLYE